MSRRPLAAGVEAREFWTTALLGRDFLLFYDDDSVCHEALYLWGDQRSAAAVLTPDDVVFDPNGWSALQVRFAQWATPPLWADGCAVSPPRSPARGRLLASLRESRPPPVTFHPSVGDWVDTGYRLAMGERGRVINLRDLFGEPADVVHRRDDGRPRPPRHRRLGPMRYGGVSASPFESYPPGNEVTFREGDLVVDWWCLLVRRSGDWVRCERMRASQVPMWSRERRQHLASRLSALGRPGAGDAPPVVGAGDGPPVTSRRSAHCRCHTTFKASGPILGGKWRTPWRATASRTGL